MTGDARRGRRDNGLTAAEYAAAGDVDPRIGEHLLDVLGLDGIAAYLRPSADMHPVTRSSSLPNRPTDRLYVDRTYLQTAQALLSRLAEESIPAPPANPPAGPPAAGSSAGSSVAGSGTSAQGLSEPEVDEAWAEIIAGFDEDVDPPSRLWPASEDVSETAKPASRRGGTTVRTGSRGAAL